MNQYDCQSSIIWYHLKQLIPKIWSFVDLPWKCQRGVGRPASAIVFLHFYLKFSFSPPCSIFTKAMNMRDVFSTTYFQDISAPASSTWCTWANGVLHFSSWTRPKQYLSQYINITIHSLKALIAINVIYNIWALPTMSWRCDGQGAVPCPILSRCTWQLFYSQGVTGNYYTLKMYLGMVSIKMFLTKILKGGFKKRKVMSHRLQFISIDTKWPGHLLTDLSTQWSSTTRCFQATLTRDSEPIWCLSLFRWLKPW